MQNELKIMENLRLTEIAMMYPRFIASSSLKFDGRTKSELITKGIEFAEKCRKGIDNTIHQVKENNDDPNPEETSLRYVSHIRQNIFEEYPDCPALLKFRDACFALAQDYFLRVYKYENKMKMRYFGDSFYQYAPDFTAGVPLHHHWDSDLTFVYYPLISYNEIPQNIFQRGVLRFFDPYRCRRRFFPNKNPMFLDGYNITRELKEDDVVLFEGDILHDSSYFGGQERLCLSFFITLDTNERKKYIA